ncbi:hypothetical protein [Paracoccus aestuariivivens]|uniref:ParB/Sulfiredoxin domain-containing protein n=1 Tax=Paracoccus aestuariivivens TaxID=1820333 RepID=A0A6L6J536_9RHOB|nr:hypothetical protein [Paracoccus aestuariivivens]MTH76345.1 hypothetical protein [Paracoccus aestuariivivens]
MDWDNVIEVGVPKRVPLEVLAFDARNPRFTPDKSPVDDSESAIIELLASTADLSELVQSIATSGYINIEPLIVVVQGDKLTVLEGNRRLAAIKCLINPEYAKAARIVVPPLRQEVLESLREILVFRVASEDDARELIGFKHINGPQAWDAYAKAQYAGRWLDSQVNEASPLSLADIASRMGDNHATIHRMVTALFVLRQAEQNEVYSIEERFKNSFSFSHLYTALSYEEYTSYLGMKRLPRNENPSREPIDKENYGKLRQLLLWLYGSKREQIQPVVKSQNPDLGRLRIVLGSKAATRELEEVGGLEAAVITATPKSERFAKHIFEANDDLRKALEALDGFDLATQAELLEVAETLVKRSLLIRHSMKMSVETQEILGEE